MRSRLKSLLSSWLGNRKAKKPETMLRYSWLQDFPPEHSQTLAVRSEEVDSALKILSWLKSPFPLLLWKMKIERPEKTPRYSC
jgi:hypothetical protein